MVFVDWNVEFVEIEDTHDPIDVANHGFYPGEVVSRMLIVWAHQQAKEVGLVAMNALQSWVDNCTRDVVYDLVVEPLARVQGDDVLTADGC